MVLNKEELERLGFEYNSWSDSSSTIYTKNNYNLFLYPDNKLSITDTNRNRQTKEGYFHYQLFEGHIQSKEEFVKLLGQIGI